MIIHQPTAPQENNRRTPPHIVEMVRQVLGEIDLDPASDEQANQVIRAKRYFDRDGLAKVCWEGRVFLNPPGGLLEPDWPWRQVPKGTRPKGSLSSMAVWWSYLEKCYRSNYVPEAIFLAFNLECMLNTQKFGPPCQAYPFCIPSKRLAYHSANGTKSESPQGASGIFYLGPNVDRFREVFSQIGFVRV